MTPRLLILLVFLLLPLTAEAAMTCPTGATCKYVRPADDGAGNDLNYGAEDGTSEATAFDGFADITGLAAGDTVCLPGSEEPFFERLTTPTSGTIVAPISYVGCGTTPALLWHAQSIAGNRSFDASRVLIETAPYAWATVDATLGIYKKRIDVRPLQLWEDSTWLQPVNIDAASEATIITTLTAGQWGNKDNGDSTYRVYYRATVPTNSPTNTTIRTEHIPLGADYGLVINSAKNFQVFRNMTLKGAASTSLHYAFFILSSSHILLENVTLTRNQLGPSLSCASACTNITFRDVTATFNAESNAWIEPGAGGFNGLTFSGGEYSDSLGSYYNGTDFTAGDGDGIGIGQAGGTGANVLIENLTMNRNLTSAVTIGTPSAMTITNVTMRGLAMDGNLNTCFNGHNPWQIVGVFTLTGFVCQGTTVSTGAGLILQGAPPSALIVTIANGVFSNNAGLANIFFRPHANLTYKFANLVFVNGAIQSGTDHGDIFGDQALDLIGTETFKNLYFYSYPNANRSFAQLNIAATHYKYNVGGDLAAFNTAAGGTNTVVNTDPVFVTATTDFRTQASSPLRRTGAVGLPCLDVRGRPCWTPPDIGGYQATHGDLVTARTAASTRAIRETP